MNNQDQDQKSFSLPKFQSTINFQEGYSEGCAVIIVQGDQKMFDDVMYDVDITGEFFRESGNIRVIDYQIVKNVIVFDLKRDEEFYPNNNSDSFIETIQNIIRDGFIKRIFGFRDINKEFDECFEDTKNLIEEFEDNTDELKEMIKLYRLDISKEPQEDILKAKHLFMLRDQQDYIRKGYQDSL